MASPGESPSGDETKKQSQEAHAQSTTPPLAQTPEPELHVEDLVHDIPPSPEELSSFDWDDFERRYEQALRDADAREREILKESESLSKVRIHHMMCIELDTYLYIVLPSVGLCCIGS